MSSKNISIIVPIYNVEKWIDRCLSSIQKQSYEDFEVLLIDDGSCDNSDDICKEYTEKDKRFKYLKKNNGGLSDARNYGIDRAKGKYLIFIDGDDYVEKNYVEKLYRAITEYTTDVAICGFANVKPNGMLIDNNTLSMTDKEILTGREVIELSFDYKKMGWSLGCAWNKIYKATLFNNLRFEKGRYYEDGLIFLFLFLNVNKAAIVHEALYDYVQRDNSIMHSEMSIKKIKDDDYSMHKWIDLFRNNDERLYRLSIQKYKDWIINKWISHQSILSENDMCHYLQQQFRIYENIEKSADFKRNIRDRLAFINLNILYYMSKVLP